MHSECDHHTQINFQFGLEYWWCHSSFLSYVPLRIEKLSNFPYIFKWPFVSLHLLIKILNYRSLANVMVYDFRVEVRQREGDTRRMTAKYEDTCKQLQVM